MATMNVSLPDSMKSWVEAQSERGQYSNASDYVRDLIRKDQERKSAIQALQTAITQGIESGELVEFDPDAFKLKMHNKHVVK